MTEAYPLLVESAFSPTMVLAFPSTPEGVNPEISEEIGMEAVVTIGKADSPQDPPHLSSLLLDL